MNDEIEMRTIPAEIASARQREIDAWQAWQEARLEVRTSEEAAKADLEARVGTAILNGEITGKNAEERAASKAVWLRRNAPTMSSRVESQMRLIELEAAYERAKGNRLHLQDELAVRLALVAQNKE